MTQSEINCDYFIVERSANAHDWTEVSYQNGAGASSKTNFYYAEDRSPLKNLSYYRLKQVDFDGTFHYSETIAITLNSAFKDATVKVFPNPVLSGNDIGLQISEYEGHSVFVEIVNAQGKIIYREKFSDHVSGNQFLSVNKEFARGVYFVRVHLENQLHTVKIVVE